MKQKRIYLINRDFQLRYAGAAVVVGTLSTVLTSFVILFPLYQFEILKIPNFVPKSIMLIMVIAALINIALIGCIGILITHRIVGPVYNMVKHFRFVEQGIWTGEMRLREGDELRYAMRNFNEMLKSLRSTCSTDISSLQIIKQKLIEDQTSENKSSAETVKLIEDLVSKMQERITPPQ